MIEKLLVLSSHQKTATERLKLRQHSSQLLVAKIFETTENAGAKEDLALSNAELVRFELELLDEKIGRLATVHEAGGNSSRSQNGISRLRFQKTELYASVFLIPGPLLEVGEEEAIGKTFSADANAF